MYGELPDLMHKLFKASGAVNAEVRPQLKLLMGVPTIALGREGGGTGSMTAGWTGTGGWS
jgi:hypothetical protein